MGGACIMGESTVPQKGGSADAHSLRERLYALVRRIPPGRVVSYKVLGVVLGVHPRVIGRILAESPGMPLVPCHRVVHTTGRIGGYAFGGGGMKKRRLCEEGVRISGERVNPASMLHLKEFLRIINDAEEDVHSP